MAEPLTVYFDATRLLARGTHSTPTGIDRVDLAYVEALHRHPDFVLRLIGFDALGPRVLPPRKAEALIEALLQRWRQRAPARTQGHPVFAWLQSPELQTRPALPPSAAPGRLQRLRQSLRPGVATLRAQRLRALPSKGRAVYLNTSHGQMYRRVVARWLERSGIASVFFVHDLIPIEYPEYNRPREAARHAARLQTISRHARQVLVNSQATATALRCYWESRGERLPPIHALPLGVDVPQPGTQPLHTPRPYFVMLGTLEPRKNHLLILQCWRRLIEQDPEGAPRLVLIGRRGWENQAVFQLLDRAESLKRHVVECRGLSDTEVADLIRGARALLMPSHAEGYGLPVVEALSLGTPVLASDIAAHREVGGDYAQYLDALDGPGWMQAIATLLNRDSPHCRQWRDRLQNYRVPGWAIHFSSALPLLHSAPSGELA